MDTKVCFVLGAVVFITAAVIFKACYSVVEEADRQRLEQTQGEKMDNVGESCFKALIGCKVKCDPKGCDEDMEDEFEGRIKGYVVIRNDATVRCSVLVFVNEPYPSRLVYVDVCHCRIIGDYTKVYKQ